MTSVRFVDVSVSYGRTVALQAASFTVAPGQLLAILGPNGSGKSTLLKVLSGLGVAYQGQVSLNGADLRSLPFQQRTARIGELWQHSSAPVGLTVAEVVNLGLPLGRGRALRAQDSERVSVALDRTGVAHLAARNAAKLSGGELQRVLLARAIVAQPPLLILDEPTNHLDPRHRFELLHLLKQLDLTCLAALHDVEAASRYADSVLVIDQGRIIGSGPPAQVLRPALLRSVFGVASTWLPDPPGGQPRLVLDRLES